MKGSSKLGVGGDDGAGDESQEFVTIIAFESVGRDQHWKVMNRHGEKYTGWEGGVGTCEMVKLRKVDQDEKLARLERWSLVQCVAYTCQRQQPRMVACDIAFGDNTQRDYRIDCFEMNAPSA